MNNVIMSLKRFFKNKNIVTVLGVFAIIAILYFGYTTTINKATAPVKVPVAAQTIQPRTEITAGMYKLIDVPSVVVSKNVIRSASRIIGKYTAVNTLIPEGSMFYTQTVVDKEQLPDSAFVDVKDGEIPVQFKVNMETTYGNSIYPGNKIDIYMKALNEFDQVIFGRLFEDIKVLAVKDTKGKHVFENSDEDREPAYILFGLKEEYFILLSKAQFLKNKFGVELILVPHGGMIVSEGETEVSTQYLVDYINANAVTIYSDDYDSELGEENLENQEVNENEEYYYVGE